MNLHSNNAPIAIERRRILKVDVAALNRDAAIGLIERLVKERRFTKIGFLNAHVANTAQTDEQFRQVLEGFLVLPDGIGVDIASRLLYGESFPANLNGTDFVPDLLRGIPDALNVGLVGATRTNIEAACDRLVRLAPQHRYHIVSDGFFSADGEAAILQQLIQLQPDILLVAMGVPRQEFWVDRLSASHATVPMAVGALFDFLSGAVPRAPEWMRRTRLEWLFRLILEPERLWRRYVLGNPVFLMHLVRQKYGRR